MSDKFYIKQGDTSPAIRYELLPRSVDLTGAGSVVFNMRDKGTQTVKVSRGVGSVVTATGTPTVQYAWDAADTDTVGDFEGEFEVEFADGSIGTFPNKGYIDIEIGDDIG